MARTTDTKHGSHGDSAMAIWAVHKIRVTVFCSFYSNRYRNCCLMLFGCTPQTHEKPWSKMTYNAFKMLGLIPEVRSLGLRSTVTSHNTRYSPLEPGRAGAGGWLGMSLLSVAGWRGDGEMWSDELSGHWPRY